MRLCVPLLLTFGACRVAALAVFAHFMLGNTEKYGVADWTADINAAKAAGIDAFAINIKKGDAANSQLNQAFSVALSLNFRFFFSFDYSIDANTGGTWALQEVVTLINTWKGSNAYYKRGSQPLVSTFEGPIVAFHWNEIKPATGCFFVPDYSSLGAAEAVRIAGGVADGLFSWAAWPAGPTDMNTYGDASYMQFLAQAGRPTYMMPISPGFYTNLPGYDKNWLWRGDDLWFDRWLQVLYLAQVQTDFAPPEFAQIISWNDYGESHYIGPLNSKALYALDFGKAPFNYVANVPHDGFRRFLPFLIQLAKTGQATVGTQGVRVWYRNSASSACNIMETVGNTCSQLQVEYPPSAVVQDRVFYSALLGAPATVTVTVGGVSLGATWSDTPPTGVGIYHGSASFAGRTGQVVVTVNGIATVVGGVPIGGCSQVNFNPYVYSANGPSSSASLNINSHVCVDGFGVGNFNSICKFACRLGYCPVTACTCSRIGPPLPKPTALQVNGYPSDGNRNYEGLCSFSVNYGYTGRECSRSLPPSPFIPKNSPFFPNTTIAGSGVAAKYNSMCQFSCRHGYCPLHLCTYSAVGVLIPLPDLKPAFGKPRASLTRDERNLCSFTALHDMANRDLCWEPVAPPPPPPPPVTTTITVTPEPTPTGGFRIYIGTESDFTGMQYDVLRLAPEGVDPTCDGGGGFGSVEKVSNKLLNVFDDVSANGGWTCDGCTDPPGANIWEVKITRIEMFDEVSPELRDRGITTSHVGFLTAYVQPDGRTYELVSTLKVGDPFIRQGWCTRTPSGSDQFQCGAVLGNEGGTFVLDCKTPLRVNVQS